MIRELGLDPEKVNVNGGAIALGHPLGMSGARLVVSLLHELRRRGGRYGLATLCVGVGQGQAALFERRGVMRTQVGIVGAGPAGLTLGRLLERPGSTRSCSRTAAATTSSTGSAPVCSSRARVDLLVEAGVGERMQARGYRPPRASSSSSTASATGSR